MSYYLSFNEAFVKYMYKSQVNREIINEQYVLKNVYRQKTIEDF